MRMCLVSSCLMSVFFVELFSHREHPFRRLATTLFMERFRKGPMYGESIKKSAQLACIEWALFESVNAILLSCNGGWRRGRGGRLLRSPHPHS